MILWTRRAIASATFYAGSASTLKGANSITISNTASEPQPSTQLSVSESAWLLGGFLLPLSAYDVYVDKLSALGFSVECLSYNDPSLGDNPFFNHDGNPNAQESTLPSLLLGHSKGAKTIATWMPFMDETIPACILIEPVDVNPPGSQPSRVLDSWKSHLSIISKIPTLIISAPYTETSKRYGKAANLCAPYGKDARAFYDVARLARNEFPEHAAPLDFVEFDRLGHNDVVANGDKKKSQIGGCANGPERSHGAALVCQSIVEWLNCAENNEIV